MKQEFKRERIELCRCCSGTGFGEPINGSSILPICPVCNGTGRVVKLIQGEVIIKPYKE